VPEQPEYATVRRAEAVTARSSLEWVWKNVKHDRIGKTGVTSKQDLKSKAIGALRRLQKRPGLVRAFFADPHLRYITA
jgi:hypothetical protein